MNRVYLDHNATTPLRAEARDAMLRAMDVVGNPASVHAEGRRAKGIVEAARAQVAALVGCGRQQVVFTGSATEAAALAVAQKGRHGGVFSALPTEHDCFYDWSEAEDADFVAHSAANSETGIMLPGGLVAEGDGIVCDITQVAGKAPVVYGASKPAYMIHDAARHLGDTSGLT
ncbi:MAG: aminotransferase class V-fold PLP-dependent enzyme, partial [Pseudomonadota bacterium]